MRQHWIIHLDLDAFFASVEELLDPRLKGKPIIVGGGPGRRGVVASASYAARVYGVKSAMPTAQALRLCPHAILVFGHPREYGRLSHKVVDILSEYTPLVEQLSIDEAFMDVTGCELLWGLAPEIAQTVQRRIEDELGLSASLGAATNKLVAKIACGQKKPGGLVVVPPGEEAAFLAPLPVEELWGVGEATAQKLGSWGAKTIGHLAQVPLHTLEREFGVVGRALWLHSHGIDDSRVIPEASAKSMGHEHTFEKDLADLREVERRLLALAEKVGRRLRFHGAQGRTITLKLRTSDFVTLTHSVTIPEKAKPISSDQELFHYARRLLHRYWQPGMRARLVGVSVSNLVYPGAEQLALLRKPPEGLSRALDWIRVRFGEEAIQRASLLGLEPLERLQDAEFLEREQEEDQKQQEKRTAHPSVMGAGRSSKLG